MTRKGNRNALLSAIGTSVVLTTLTAAVPSVAMEVKVFAIGDLSRPVLVAAGAVIAGIGPIWLMHGTTIWRCTGTPRMVSTRMAP